MWAKSVSQTLFEFSPTRSSQQSPQTFWQGRLSEVHIVHAHELRVDQAYGSFSEEKRKHNDSRGAVHSLSANGVSHHQCGLGHLEEAAGQLHTI
jgi:hypothetical protein